MKQYIIYIAIAIFASFLGAAVSHFYSRNVISSLQEEIDTERKQSLKTIKDHQAEIDTLTSKSEQIKKNNEMLLKVLNAERNKRLYFKRKDSTYIISKDEDSIINYLRKKLN